MTLDPYPAGEHALHLIMTKDQCFPALPPDKQSVQSSLEEPWPGADIGTLGDFGTVSHGAQRRDEPVSLPRSLHLLEDDALEGLMLHDCDPQINRDSRPSENVLCL